MPERWDALVIGGGFYGLNLAEFLAGRLPRVLLCERAAGLMGRASFANRVREYAFDGARLKEIIAERVRRAGVEVRLNTTAEWVWPLPGGSVRVRLTDSEVTAGMVIGCAYSQTNAVAAGSGLPVIPLKHE